MVEIYLVLDVVEVCCELGATVAVVATSARPSSKYSVVIGKGTGAGGRDATVGGGGGY
jgi:hypothetical protein